MSTLDLEIIGFEEGEGRLAGTLGAILVRYKNGNIVKVGSGFSDRLRIEIWASRDEWLGNICEIQSFEETTNADGGESLRFPVFKDYRPDKVKADY
jgi:DNA ligase-1